MRRPGCSATPTTAFPPTEKRVRLAAATRSCTASRCHFLAEQHRDDTARTADDGAVADQKVGLGVLHDAKNRRRRIQHCGVERRGARLGRRSDGHLHAETNSLRPAPGDDGAIAQVKRLKTN